MIPWSTIVTLAKQVYDQAEKAQANKKQSKLLSERIRSLITSAEAAGNIRDNEAFSDQVDYFKKTLDQAVELTGHFEDEHWIKRFFKAGGWKDKFTEIRERLTNTIEAFQLAAQLQDLMNRETDQKALADDLQDLSTKIKEVLGAQYHTLDELQTVVETLETMKNLGDQLSEDHGRIFDKLNELGQLVNNLKRELSKAKTEIIVVDEGAIANNVVNRFVVQEFTLEVPEKVLEDSKKLERAQDFFSGLRKKVPQGNVKITVVKKGGKVDDLLQETKDLLATLKVTSEEASLGTQPSMFGSPSSSLSNLDTQPTGSAPGPKA